MMKKIVLMLLAVLMLGTTAFAQVVTTDATQGYGGYLYVAGDADNYPIEYYDEDKKAFCGVIPDLLGIISQRTGLDFVYINGGGRDRKALGENLQVDIVSSAAAAQSGYVELLSCGNDGSAGIAFTEVAPLEAVAKIRLEAAKITAAEKNALLLSYAEQSAGNSRVIVPMSVLLLLMLLMAVIMVYTVRRVRRENETDKMTDFETGMGNLRYFKHHFSESVCGQVRSLYSLAYIVLDSSYLRSYHGDSSFDDVLKFTASVLSEHTGDREISARITENGFAFVFRSMNIADAEKRLGVIMNTLNGFEGVRGRGRKLVFHAAVYQLTPMDRNCEILLFNLRKNVNTIFGSDTQIVCCDTHSMNLVQEEKQITERILDGFENNEFRMYLQFVVDRKNGAVIGAEALSRWNNREKGLLSPAKYIPNMEASGLISKHDFYMFSLACRQLEEWNGTQFGSLSISCNFTRITLSEENFIEKIRMISDGFSFDKSKLAIEITEDAIEKDRKTATENVRLCRELGFKIYLDDLGSGYTSLANLCDYPIDVVKIDRDILLKTDTQRGRDLFSGIVALAHSLGIHVIAEGVETAAQNALVSASECDFIQGWYYSKVLPPEEFEAFLHRKQVSADEAEEMEL